MNPVKKSADFLKGVLDGSWSGWTSCGWEEEDEDGWAWLRLIRAVNAPPELVSGGDGVECLSSSSNMELDPVTDMLSFSKWSSVRRLSFGVREVGGSKGGLTRLSLKSRSVIRVSGVGREVELLVVGE